MCPPDWVIQGAGDCRLVPGDWGWRSWIQCCGKADGGKVCGGHTETQIAPGHTGSLCTTDSYEIQLSDLLKNSSVASAASKDVQRDRGGREREGEGGREVRRRGEWHKRREKASLNKLDFYFVQQIVHIMSLCCKRIICVVVFLLFNSVFLHIITSPPHHQFTARAHFQMSLYCIKNDIKPTICNVVEHFDLISLAQRQKHIFQCYDRTELLQKLIPATQSKKQRQRTGTFTAADVLKFQEGKSPSILTAALWWSKSTQTFWI